MEPYPRLQKLFSPLAQCIKKGDLYAFDQALKDGEEEFVKRRIYLPLERAHDICLRNLLRKVFIAGGFEDPKPEASDAAAAPSRRTRVTVPEFTAAINISSKQQVDSDEVECQLANMIYKVSPRGVVRTMVVAPEQPTHFRPSLALPSLTRCLIPPTLITTSFFANVTMRVGSHEGLRSPREADCSTEQEGRRFPRHRRLR